MSVHTGFHLKGVTAKNFTQLALGSTLNLTPKQGTSLFTFLSFGRPVQWILELHGNISISSLFGNLDYNFPTWSYKNNLEDVKKNSYDTWSIPKSTSYIFGVVNPKERGDN